MSREREWQRNRRFAGEEDEHEAVWQALAERVCPIDSTRPGGPQRIAHQDLIAMSGQDLELERRRAMLRSCLERDGYSATWLERRIERIEDEMEQRGASVAAVVPAASPAHPAPTPARGEAEVVAARRIASLERALDRAHHDSWTYWREARQLRARLTEPATPAGWQVLPGGAASDAPDPWDMEAKAGV